MAAGPPGANEGEELVNRRCWVDAVDTGTVPVSTREGMRMALVDMGTVPDLLGHPSGKNFPPIFRGRFSVL